MVSECHCCEGSFPSEKSFSESEKNEIKFNNLKLISCPDDLFHVAFIGCCNLAIQRGQYKNFFYYFIQS